MYTVLLCMRYNQSMTNLSEDKIIALYNLIRQGLKKKYPKAQTQIGRGTIIADLKEWIHLSASF